MDIRRQTAQELQGGTNVPDGRSSGGVPGNRLSAADNINHRIGRISLPSGGSSAADSLAALAARNDMVVRGGPGSRLSVRSGNLGSVSFMNNANSASSGANIAQGSNETNTNVVLSVPSGPSSLVGHSANTGILDTSGGVVEPLDYEEYVQQHQRAYGNISGRSVSNNTRVQTSDAADDRLHLIDFPADDIEVNVVPRKIRTVQHVVPEQPL